MAGHQVTNSQIFCDPTARLYSRQCNNVSFMNFVWHDRKQSKSGLCSSHLKQEHIQPWSERHQSIWAALFLSLFLYLIEVTGFDKLRQVRNAWSCSDPNHGTWQGGMFLTGALICIFSWTTHFCIYNMMNKPFPGCYAWFTTVHNNLIC
jgi:hypothetical protein